VHRSGSFSRPDFMSNYDIETLLTLWGVRRRAFFRWAFKLVPTLVILSCMLAFWQKLSAYFVICLLGTLPLLAWWQYPAARSLHQAQASLRNFKRKYRSELQIVRKRHADAASLIVEAIRYDAHFVLVLKSFDVDVYERRINVEDLAPLFSNGLEEELHLTRHYVKRSARRRTASVRLVGGRDEGKQETEIVAALSQRFSVVGVHNPVDPIDDTRINYPRLSMNSDQWNSEALLLIRHAPAIVMLLSGASPGVQLELEMILQSGKEAATLVIECEPRTGDELFHAVRERLGIDAPYDAEQMLALETLLSRFPHVIRHTDIARHGVEGCAVFEEWENVVSSRPRD
jgi:hypothetical protein